MQNEKNNKPGRPKAEIDWDLLAQLGESHTSGIECANYIGVHYDTIVKRYQKEMAKKTGIPNFSQFLRSKRDKGKAQLKLDQYKTAKEGNTTMQVWLGKNWLGQSDRVENKNENTNNNFVNIPASKAIEENEQTEQNEYDQYDPDEI